MNAQRSAGALAVLLAVALSVTSCGGGGDEATEDTSPTPERALEYALWPDPAKATAQSTPREVGRSFVEDFAGIRRPALGAFQQGDSRSGELLVFRRGENGRRTKKLIATIALRQLDGKRWFVIAAFSEEVQIMKPGSLADISPPVKITGSGVGHEGNIVVQVHAAFDPKPLAREAVIAGATRPQPFSVELAFAPRSGPGAILVRAGQPLPGADAFAALPVRFGAG